MSDLIDRQAAIDAVKDRYYKYDRFAKVQELVWSIEDLPSAQPEIIRCRDCKHWREDHTCREHSLVSPMMAYEFCSRAERREE